MPILFVLFFWLKTSGTSTTFLAHLQFLVIYGCRQYLHVEKRKARFLAYGLWLSYCYLLLIFLTLSDPCFFQPSFAYLNLQYQVSFVVWVPISSTSKFFFYRIKDLRFNLYLRQKPISVLVKKKNLLEAHQLKVLFFSS